MEKKVEGLEFDERRISQRIRKLGRAQQEELLVIIIDELHKQDEKVKNQNDFFKKKYETINHFYYAVSGSAFNKMSSKQIIWTSELLGMKDLPKSEDFKDCDFMVSKRDIIGMLICVHHMEQTRFSTYDNSRKDLISSSSRK